MADKYRALGVTSKQGNAYLKQMLIDSGFELAALFEIDVRNLDRIMMINCDIIVVYTDRFRDEEWEFIEKLNFGSNVVKVFLLTGRHDADIYTKAAQYKVSKVLTTSMSPEEINRSITGMVEDKIKIEEESEEMKKGSKFGKKITTKFSTKSETNINENTVVKERIEEAAPKPKLGKIISVYGTKGGTGKSTMSVNLATALQITGKSVAIIDLDLQFGDVGVFMNVPKVDTISDLIQEDSFNTLTVKRYMYHHSSGVDVLPAPDSPELAEIVKPDHIKKIVDAIRNEYDYIIFDMSPTIDEYVLHALDISDCIYFVTNPEISTLKNTKVCLNVLNTLGYYDKVKIILNKDGESYVKKSDMEATLGKEMALVIPRDSKSAIAAINRGVPLVAANPHSKVTKILMKYIESENI